MKKPDPESAGNSIACIIIIIVALILMGFYDFAAGLLVGIVGFMAINTNIQLDKVHYQLVLTNKRLENLEKKLFMNCVTKNNPNQGENKKKAEIGDELDESDQPDESDELDESDQSK
jgi:hypothetical protein